ncbi:MAG TPA: hypothetical protein VK465_07075 [Fibrobacteria bacterium]|nr:hypothetical protein [Fibrobacteria bacterium]
MRKAFCDACGKEIVGKANHYSSPCHLVEKDKIGKLGYVDVDNNPVSGRMVEFDLCNRCSNRVHGAAAKELFAVQAASSLPHKRLDTAGGVG